MCDLFGGGSSNDQTVTSQTKLDPDLKNAALYAMNYAKGIAGQPYPTYPGQRQAGITPDETAGLDMTRAAAGGWQPTYDQGVSTLTNFSNLTWPQADVQGYMSPYIDQALQPAIEERARQGDIERANIGRQMAADSAFGGSRHGVVEGESYRNQDQDIANLAATGYQAAYDRANQAFNSDRSAAMGAAGGLLGASSQGQQQSYTDAAQRFNVGQFLQSFGQQGLDQAYQDFQNQRDWPVRNLNVLLSALSGSPLQQNSSTTQTGPSSSGSPAAQYLGAFGSLVGALGSLGGAGSSAGFNWSNLWPF